jgi:hypothetical protein
MTVAIFEQSMAHIKSLIMFVVLWILMFHKKNPIEMQAITVIKIAIRRLWYSEGLRPVLKITIGMLIA